MRWLPHDPTIVGCLWHLEKRLLGSRVGFDSEPVPNASVYEPDHHFQGQWLDVFETLPDFPTSFSATRENTSHF